MKNAINTSSTIILFFLFSNLAIASTMGLLEITISVSTHGRINSPRSFTYSFYRLTDTYYTKNNSDQQIVNSGVSFSTVLTNLMNVMKSGQSIEILSGNYTLDALITVSKSDITIYIHGGATITARNWLNTTMFRAVKVTGLSVIGQGVIDGNRLNNLPQSTYNDVGSGIVLSGCTNSFVGGTNSTHMLEIRNCFTRGIVVRDGSHDNILQFAYVHHCGDDRLVNEGRYDNIVLARGYRNHVLDCVSEYPYRDCIVVYAEYDSEVLRSTCRGPAFGTKPTAGGIGIFVDGAATTQAYNILVADCLIEDTLDGYIGCSYEGTVANLIIRNCTLQRVSAGGWGGIGLGGKGIDGAIVENCKIKNVYGNGIQIGGTYARNVEVKNCEVTNCSRSGIRIFSSATTNVTITNCTILDNNLALGGWSNVQIEDGYRITVENNIIGNTGNGYEVFLGTPTHDCGVINNDLRGVHKEAILDQGTNNTISGNQT